VSDVSRRFGQDIRRIRQARGLSYRGLADQVDGVDPTTIWRLEHGRQEPSLSKAYALARALDIRFRVGTIDAQLGEDNVIAREMIEEARGGRKISGSDDLAETPASSSDTRTEPTIFLGVDKDGR
jgi:transcriptional regulator with XRE-family HTH domain